MAISVVLGRRDLKEVDMTLLLKKSPAASQARGGLEHIDCDRFVEILGELDSDVIVAKSCVKKWLKQMYLMDILAETFVSQVTTLSFLYGLFWLCLHTSRKKEGLKQLHRCTSWPCLPRLLSLRSSGLTPRIHKFTCNTCCTYLYVKRTCRSRRTEETPPKSVT